MNPGSSWKFVPQGDKLKGSSNSHFVRSSKIAVFSIFCLDYHYDGLSQPTMTKAEGDRRRIMITSREYQHPPLLGEGPLMGSSTAWKFAAFQSWSPSTRKLILDGVCFSTISLTQKDLQMKISQVSNYVCTNLVTEQKSK